MRKLTHTSNRNEVLSEKLPTIGDQLDAIWNILLSNPATKDAVEADPVFQRISDMKAKYPKVPRGNKP